MAFYSLDVKPFGRKQGARITQAAAYRAGERIRDERTGELYSYLSRRDVVYKEVVIPSQFAGNAAMAWTQDRATLWNAVESTERSNARLGREVYVAVPDELSAAQRTQLVRGFAQELADRYQCAVDTCIHLPRKGNDERTHHAHLLMTPCQVTPKGLGGRTTLELSGKERRTLGLLGRSKDDLLWKRERWAQVANEALKAAGLSVRIDHRSLRAQGIDREPALKLPRVVSWIERQTGKPSEIGDRIRREHRERVEAREKGPDELARVVQRQKAEAFSAAIERDIRAVSLPKGVSRAALNKEELAQVQRDRKRAKREAEREIAPSAGLTPEQQSVRRWLDWRKEQPTEDRDPSGLTPEQQSVRRWLDWRKEQPTEDRDPSGLTPEQQSVRRWLDWRKEQPTEDRDPSGLTPEQQSVRRWLTWRKEQQAHGQFPPEPTAEQSVRNGLACREAQKHELDRVADQDDDDRRSRRKTIDRDRDYDLEL